MKITRVRTLPMYYYKGGEYESSDITSLINDSITGDIRLVIDQFVYWYATGNYCGAGYALIKIKDSSMWLEQDLGHCSCYGPMEEFTVNVMNIKSLDEIRRSSTPEHFKDIKLIYEKAKEIEG